MNRVRSFAAFAFATVVASSAFAAEPPATLTWNDLVNRPDRWPATVKLTRAMKFADFQLPAGASVPVDSVGRKEAMLVSPKNSIFAVGPDDCDLLAAANAIWAKLTPAQRSLTPDAVAKDPSLWPAEAAPTSEARFKGLTLPAGKPQRVARINPNGDVAFYVPGQKGLWTVAMKETDAFARARERAGQPVEARAGRLSTLFAGATIDAAGKPADLRDAKYFVYYVAASTCPRCEVFTPKLVEHVGKSLAGREDVQFVTTTTEGALPPFLAYAQSKSMPFPILRMEAKDASSGLLIRPGTVIEIPGLVVADRFGNVLLSTTTTPGAPLDAAEAVLAKLDATIPAKAE